MRSLSESEMLATGIPKLIWLYKSRILTARIAEINAILASNPSDEKVEECLLELAHLNKLKVSISNHVGRLII